MNYYNRDGVTVDVVRIPRKNKTYKNKYCIYIGFNVATQGIKEYGYEISTGINVPITEWKEGKASGKNSNARLINERLNSYERLAEEMLDKIKSTKPKTARQVYNEIVSNAKQTITGKAPQGKKEEYLNKLKELDYENVMNKYLEDKKQCTERQKKYKVPHQHLTQYFATKGHDLPRINQITSKDLEDFKSYLLKKGLKYNTINSYLIMIVAVFNHAKKLNLINETPRYTGFTGDYVPAKIDLISEHEIRLIHSVEDSTLTPYLLVAKYLMLFQSFTALGIKEIKSLDYNHFKYEINDYGQRVECIQKDRTKTGEEYLIPLSVEAKRIKDKLIELCGSEEIPFNLPSNSLITRRHKEIGKLAGITKNTAPYQFRRSFATNYLTNGGYPTDLQKIMGHKEIASTMVYAKVTPTKLIRESERMEKDRIDREKAKEEYQNNLRVA